MALGFVMNEAISDRADSVDSHTVNNYLEDSGASQALKDRFNSVNSDWPPSRTSLGLILLDAKRRQSEGKISTNTDK